MNRDQRLGIFAMLMVAPMLTGVAVSSTIQGRVECVGILAVGAALALQYLLVKWVQRRRARRTSGKRI